ncbi:unnamed protein product [Rotaria sordida]|uniref:Retinoblastoma-associated protein A-box domain-containing protein n=1 Tax=Rotaria sordida TaxID=392033 RepID=A0A815P9C8_9BILA|nr:unnamed protein product [Rotaria sordida]
MELNVNKINNDLVERLNTYEYLFNSQYDLVENVNKISREENPSRSCKSRFDLSLKLFYYSIENILTIEKGRLNLNKFDSQQIQQSFHKLILNNEFMRSLLGLCLLLVLYAHSDKYHDFNWILHVYSLDGYSFLKIIQIFLQTCKQIHESTLFIKYLSSIEEHILSSMAFSTKSSLWNDIELKGILSYKTISSIQSNINNSLSSINNVTRMFSQSSNKTNVSRKLFQSNTTDQLTNKSTINRSKSDGIVENNDKKHVKLSPYTMFYFRSVFIRSINKYDFIENEENIHKNPCLTSSKPAETINLIDGNIIGDISSFYKEIFLNIPFLEKNLENNLKENQLIDLPYRNKTFENIKSGHVNVNISSNTFINYSSNKIQSNIYSSSSNNQTNYLTRDIQTNPTSNVLSSLIQADGKFLTTISTISKINNSNENQDNILINRNEKNLFFGQSTNNSVKRTLSDDSNSNCLTSLTKKVLQIEKDRQKIEEY